MYMLRFMLMIAVGLLPVLPRVPSVPAFAVDTPSNCCGDQCECAAQAVCPCAAAPDEDAPGAPSAPAIPSPERVVIQTLFDRDTQPLFDLQVADESSRPAFLSDRQVFPTDIGQRLSFLCLRLT